MRFSPSTWTILAVAALAFASFGAVPAAQAQAVKNADDIISGLQPLKTRF